MSDVYTLVEYMPEHLHESHRAARNSGVYPHNGAVRVWVRGELKGRQLNAQWASIVRVASNLPAGETALDDAPDEALSSESTMKNLYTYTIFDADPNTSSGTAWDTHTDIELETDDDESAIEQVTSVMGAEASGLNQEDGYTAGQRLHAIVWDSDGAIVGQPTYELTHGDLGTEPE